MVATRHSLPGAAAADESAGEGPVNKKTKNALKKLHIAGKGTLVGEKRRAEEQQQVDTFHYRGASYVVTKDTKPEWVDKQPMRWRKRASTMEETDGDEASEVEVQQDDFGDRRKDAHDFINKKRKRASEPSFEASSEAETKRRRRSAPANDRTLPTEGSDNVDLDTPRRSRRQLPEVYYGRPQRPVDESDGVTPRKRRKPRTEQTRPISNSILYDYTRVGGQDEKSCQEHARDRAILRGWEVAPIKHDTVTMKVLKSVAYLARTNSKMDKVVAEYQEAERKLEACRERLRQKKAQRAAAGTKTDDLRSKKDNQPPNEKKPLDGVSVKVTPPASTRPAHKNKPLPPPRIASQSNRKASSPTAGQSSSVEVEEPSIPVPPSRRKSQSPRRLSNAPITDDNVNEDDNIGVAPLRHDSATSLPTGQPTQTAAENKITTSNLPTANRGGQRLRWSLSTNLTNPDRAEAGIHFGRMEGESKSARRRRVKRELNMIRKWGLAEPARDETEGRSGQQGRSAEPARESQTRPKEERDAGGIRGRPKKPSRPSPDYDGEGVPGQGRTVYGYARE